MQSSGCNDGDDDNRKRPYPAVGIGIKADLEELRDVVLQVPSDGVLPLLYQLDAVSGPFHGLFASRNTTKRS
ncbi:hypothetical protein ACLOJK_040597 [Asimina triloba]